MLNNISNVYLRRLALIVIGLPVIALAIAFAYVGTHLVAAYEATKSAIWDFRHEFYHARIEAGMTVAYARRAVPLTWAR